MELTGFHVLQYVLDLPQNVEIVHQLILYDSINFSFGMVKDSCKKFKPYLVFHKFFKFSFVGLCQCWINAHNLRKIYTRLITLNEILYLVWTQCMNLFVEENAFLMTYWSNISGGSLGSICPVVWSGIGHIDPGMFHRHSEMVFLFSFTSFQLIATNMLFTLCMKLEN